MPTAAGWKNSGAKYEPEDEIEELVDEVIDRSDIVRNFNGSEEPHSRRPELWNIDGTELDLVTGPHNHAHTQMQVHIHKKKSRGVQNADWRRPCRLQNAKYGSISQLDYLQGRAKACIEDDKPIAGKPMNARAKRANRVH